jgi:8-oxo-dGTP diphosphatase/2-hydroxy-dATP diphosphatase
MEEKHYSLVFCRRISPMSGQKEILLGMKKRGFGTGKWNGYGGKMEPGETIERCAVREMEEESGVLLTDLAAAGYLHFTMGESKKLMHVHVFESFVSGDVSAVETEEMSPRWFAEDSVPFADMWADDPIWFPYFLAGKNFNGKFVFADDSTIISHDISLTGVERKSGFDI